MAKQTRLSLRRREALTGYLFISPWIVGFLIFTIGPMFASLYYSFTDFDIINPPVWNNFANYKKIFSGIFEAILTHDSTKLGDPIFWQRIFNPRTGILNAIILEIFHVKGPGWLSDPQWAIPALVIMGLWGVGGSMIIYLAGLQGVTTDFYDAAKGD